MGILVNLAVLIRMLLVMVKTWINGLNIRLIMKNLFKIGMLAVAALAFASCNKEVDIQKSQGTHVVTIKATKDFETRTAIDEQPDQAYFVWTSGDEAYFHIYENGIEATSVSMTIDENGLATFTASFNDTDATSFEYTAKYFKEESNKHNPLIVADQKPTLTSFDPSADVLIANPELRNEPATELQFALRRVVSINKMTLKGLVEGEKISSVELASTDKNFSAHFVAASTEVGDDGTVTEKPENYSAAGKKLTFDYSELTGATVGSDGTFAVYFVSAPVEDATFSVKVTTDQNVYERTLTSKLTLVVGQVKRFGIQLGDYGTPISTGTEYVLVESMDDLYSGATYLVVSNDCALGAQKYDSNNKLTNRNAVGVTVSDDVITIDNTVDAYPVVIEDVAGGYSMKVSGGYLYTDEIGANRLKERSDVGTDNYAVWTISINDGVANISNVGNTSRGQMRFNPNNGNPMFACYATTGTAGTPDLALYVDESTCVVLTDPELSFSGDATINVAWDDKDSFVAPTLTKPAELTATYSSSNPKVATVDENSGAITFVGNGTTNITATTPKTGTYKAGSAYYTLVVTGAPAAKGTEENPYTISEALVVIDGLEAGSDGKTEEEVCVAGVISEVISFSSKYSSLTYNITADGNTSSDFIQIYSGKGVNGANFTSIDDLSAGDRVVVKGYLMKYVSGDNTTPEFYQNSTIISRTPAPYFRVSELSANQIAYTGGNSISFTVFANVNWTASINNSATLKVGDATASTSVSGTSDATVTVIIPENPNGATYTISFTTTSEDVTAPDNLTITQNNNQVQTVKKYVKVTSGTIGGEYLIVRESSKYIFDGSLTNPDAAANYQEAEDLSSLDYDDWKAYAVTIEAYSTGYSIKTASGLYIGKNANSNGIDSNETLSANYVNTISFASNGTATILGNGGRKFNFNSTSGKFRYFASGNSTEIYLYQLQEVSE